MVCFGTHVVGDTIQPWMKKIFGSFLPGIYYFTLLIQLEAQQLPSNCHRKKSSIVCVYVCMCVCVCIFRGVTQGTHIFYRSWTTATVVWKGIDNVNEKRSCQNWENQTRVTLNVILSRHNKDIRRKKQFVFCLLSTNFAFGNQTNTVHQSSPH